MDQRAFLPNSFCPTPVRRLSAPRQAFTLVELLVVIGIIALLISILLPAPNKTREQSYKVKCLSGIRQLGLAMSIYAAENNDCVPIGTMITWDAAAKKVVPSTGIENWFSYYAYWKNGNGEKATGLGKLATLKVLQSAPMAYFCPKEDRVGLSYDTGDTVNPWAFKTNPPGNVGRHTYISYWVRPIAAFPATNDSDAPVLLEGYYTSTAAVLPTGWPKFSKLKSKAIISDIARNPNDIKARHKDGINVYYANGSGKYVKVNDFSKATGTTTLPPPGPIVTPATPGPKWVDQVWSDVTSPASTNPGQGSPAAGDTTFPHNMIYLNSRPTFPGVAGVWNWLDKAP